VDDLGAIAARAFADPKRFIGKELTLVGDVQSLAECRALYREVMGTLPPQLPMPSWLFQRFGFVGRDLTTMWHWLRSMPLIWIPHRRARSIRRRSRCAPG
jgi:hypothetical protein